MINADSYPKEYIILELLISEKLSNSGRHSFIAVGLMLLLLLFIRNGCGGLLWASHSFTKLQGEARSP